MTQHISDELILKALDGELSIQEAHRIELHLADCWSCRTHRRKLEAAIADFVEVYETASLPSPQPGRALLKARIAQLSQETSRPRFSLLRAAMVACVLLAGALGAWFALGGSPPGVLAVAVPNRGLTPGATIVAEGTEVCRESSTKNREVPVALRRRVFEEYGIAHAEPRAYEVDYLITPALGGADDIHNLWPQSYANTPWNAEVKDALEDHLRGLVCQGQVDLATAQREIANDWIAAYKKYFHTDRPLPVQQ